MSALPRWRAISKLKMNAQAVRLKLLAQQHDATQSGK
jgi:hypothetical protein